MRFFQGTLEQVKNSHGKKAINVRATEVLLYIFLIKWDISESSGLFSHSVFGILDVGL